MRLLFIYFYENFGTFEKGSIIHLSKKYKFTLEKEKSTENQFYFNKEENLNFIEDFYSKNIDIGVLIGENGTGKSVLLNSIRDSKNDYSICVYEEESQFFSFSNQKMIFIENQKIIERKLEYIYYTSIIDAFDNDIKSDYNISNRSFLTKNDKLPLNNRLSLIENDDIHRYINFSKYSKLDYVKIEKLKLYCSETYFDEIKKELIDKHKEELFKYLIQNINFTKNDKAMKEIINHLKKHEIEDLYSELIVNDNLFSILQNNDDLLNKINFIKLIEKEILKYDINELQINEIMEEILNSNEMKYLENEIYDFLIDHLFDKNYGDLVLKNLYDNNYPNLEILIDEIFSKLNLDIFRQIIENLVYEKRLNDYILDILDKLHYLLQYLAINKIKNNISQKLLIEFRKNYRRMSYKSKRHHNQEEKELINLVDKSIMLIIAKHIIMNKEDLLSNLDVRILKEFITKAVKEKCLTLEYLINNFKIKLDKQNLLSEYLESFAKDIINVSDNINIVRLLFSLSFCKYSHQLHTNQKLKLQSLLNILMFLDNPIDKFKEFEKFDELNIIKELDEHFNIFMRVGNILEEPIEEENGEVITELTDNFFETYKLIIENFIKPFTYELYPSLSSGQKAILFIFARINDAIQKIKIKKENENILIFLDEADLKLHLEWQRQFLYDLIKFLNSYPNNKFYVLYATHSPMILSDITNDRVVFLKKREDNPNFSEDKQDFSKSTFGANIYDIYSDSFFVNNFMGEFAQNKINEVIKIIDEYKEKKEKNPDEFMPNEKALDNLKIVKSIGEPLLRNKLEDEIKSLVKDDIMEIVNNLKDMKNEEIEKELEKYSQFTQTKVLIVYSN